MFRMLNSVVVNIQPGTYYIGDISHCFTDEHFADADFSTTIKTINGVEVVSMSVPEYDSFNCFFKIGDEMNVRSLCMKSNQFGLVPIDAIEKGSRADEDKDWGVVLTLTEDAIFYPDDLENPDHLKIFERKQILELDLVKEEIYPADEDIEELNYTDDEE